MSKKKGQITVEMVLVLTLCLIMAQLLTKGLKEQNVINSFITGPWKIVSGMMESGVWKTPEKARPLHPLATKNNNDRTITKNPRD